MANWYDRQSKASLAAHILSQETEIARLTAALAEAEARTAALVAAAYEAAALVCDKTAQEFYAEEDQDFCAPIAVRMASLAAEIRALAQKEAGE